MKFLRNNFAYVVLALIAVVLIFVTISLQVAILSTRGTEETQAGRGLLYTLRQQLAELIQPATDTPIMTGATVGVATVRQPAPTAVATPTNTPNVIVVQPSPLPSLPPATPAAAILMATGTTIQVPGLSNANALATRLAAPTATSATSAIIATTTPAALPTVPSTLSPTTLPPVDADFRIGYVAGNADCVVVTDLMKLIFERQFNLRVATVAFPDAAALFEKLATKGEAERVDLSFCYLDPADRSYLQKYFGFMIFIGSGYRQLGDQKYIIMSNAAAKSPIERGNPCLYRFLTNLNLSELDLGNGDVAAWYQSHVDQVATWVRCEQ